MLTYPIEERNGESLYNYLYKCIKEDILAGRLESGSRLPSKRSFAKNLDVSVITVENAYSQLAAEGFIYSVEKKGYYVAQLSKWTGMRIVNNRDIQPVQNSDSMNKNNSGDIKIDLAGNIVNYDRFPFSTWSKLTRKILSEQDEGLLRAAPVKGIYGLRKAIAGYLYNYRGFEVSPERIVIGSGTEYLYGIIVRLLGRSRIYAVEDPGYYKASYVLEGNGVKCVHIPIDSSGMCIDMLDESGADIAHLTPSHHFPSGIVMPIQRRLEFMDWACAKEGRYLIEDDYDCEFRHQGKPIQTMSGIDREGRVIYINTFSKTLAPSFRISYMVLPEGLMERFEQTMSYMSCTVPNIDQYVLARFISEGYYERHINRMRVIYRGIRDELMSAIRKSSYGNRISIMEENAGLHFLVRIDTDMDDNILVRRAASIGLRIRCLSDYAYNRDNSTEHIVILNYSGIRTDDIGEAVRLLGDIIEKK